MAHQSLFDEFGTRHLSQEIVFDKNIITDRGSKYSILAGVIGTSKQEVKSRLDQHLGDKFFRKATHNTYAYRFLDEEGFIIEGSDDDGETGASKIILEHMQRAHLIDAIVVVTRYYGGKQLHADRFRHVVDAIQYVISRYTSS